MTVEFVVDVPSTKAPRKAQLQLKPAEIQHVVTSFLKKCGLVYPVIPDHSDFTKECRELSIARGYITEEDQSFAHFIPGGVSMACNAYPHSASREIQMYICLYTVFLIYLDDMFENDIQSVAEFNTRFVTGQPQRRKVLDDFADFLLEMPDLWGTVVANIMTTSTLNLVTALSLENELEGVKLRSTAGLFPTFSRVMSGASETYALFIFPPGLPLKTYLPALPDLMIYINCGNDILSFYKEESAGETVNRIHLLAKLSNRHQSEVLSDLVNEAVAAHNRILDMLSPCEEAYNAYLKFSQGYIGFHAGLPARYRLNELEL